jgi:DUF2934 family protein
MDRTYDDVARRAYDLFLSRGGQHGHDIDDWLEAERQLRSTFTTIPMRSTRRLASAPRPTRIAGKPRKRPQT